MQADQVLGDSFDFTVGQVAHRLPHHTAVFVVRCPLSFTIRLELRHNVVDVLTGQARKAGRCVAAAVRGVACGTRRHLLMQQPAAIDTLTDTYFASGGEIRAMLRTLFNSDFFKRAQFAKVKSPAEMVAGAARQSGGFAFPDVEDIQLALQTGNMGQMLVDPPSVEGWHSGTEWVTTASLVNRVNFAVQQFADTTKPGVRSIIERVQERGSDLSPDQMVDNCLELMGAMSVSPRTRQELVEHAADANGDDQSVECVKELLQMIVATREYQMA